MEASEDEDRDDVEINEQQQSKLINMVQSLDRNKNKRPKVTINEPTVESHYGMNVTGIILYCIDIQIAIYT